MDVNNLAQVQDVPSVTETPTVSPTETPTGEETNPSQGGEQPINIPDEPELPFHKHPRWIAKNREIEDMRHRLEELAPLAREIETIRQRPTSPQDVELPQWWRDAFGDDDSSKQSYRKQLEHEETLKASWKDELKRELKAEAEAEKTAYEASVQKWEQRIEDQIQALRDKGYKFNKNELLKVVDDYSKDADGNYIPDYIFPFDKAYEILQLKKTAPSATDTARQTAAHLSATDTNTGKTVNTVPTLEEIRKRGWGSWRDVA